ncbi:MAG: hypothetical protein U0P45_01075 [Acidimicrobiales bacterium]
MTACGELSARARQRGASLVEVALIVAVVAMVALVALRFVGSRSNRSLDAAGQTIHAAGTDDGVGGGGGGGAGGGGGTTVPPAVEVTTTLAAGGGGSGTGDVPPPPTTTSTTNTTTTSPTTTTSAPTPTTTASAPAVASARIADPSARMVGSTSWQASATLTLEDQTGAPMAGATVTVRIRTLKVAWNGSQSWVTTTMDATVDADGHVALDTGPYKYAGGNRITKVEYTVTDVALAGEGSWDGTTATTTIGAP